VIRISIKDLFGRKLRLALTSLAIVMGVAMVSGTYVLTDTIDAAFSSIFQTAYSTSDAVITGEAVFGGTQNAPSFPASALDRVKKLPAVEDAAGGVGDLAQYVGKDGKVLALHGAPGLAFSVSSNDTKFNPLTLLSGAWPKGAGEVAVDKKTASKLDVGVGGTVGLLPRGGEEQRFRVTGIAQFGTSTLGGATLAIFDLPTAQKLFHKQGELDEIDVARKSGYTTATLLDQIRSVLPPHTQVRTSQAQAQKASSDTSNQLSFLRYFLLAFGGIALFVGAFVIANTLSITIAQRTREFATLRSMGATGKQILAVVVVEGLITGLVASAIGLFVGLGLAKGLVQIFKAFGADLS
jgi:putative ABC transport system permease protein